MKAFPFILFVILLVQSCSKGTTTVPSDLITSRGKFLSPNGTYELVVGKSSKSLIDYKIIRIASTDEFTPEHLFSDIMRWAFYWENDTTLWVYSSDIGTSVWKGAPDGTFSEERVGRKPELIPSIPQELYDYLSKRQPKTDPLRQPNFDPPWLNKSYLLS